MSICLCTCIGVFQRGQTGTWSPSMGSEEWMKNGHEVMDMGDDNGAGLHEAENQAPAYAEKIADALHQYLTAGAMQKQSDARLESMLSGEIASLRHLHENMGFLSFLPFKVPFFESVDKQDEKVREEGPPGLRAAARRLNPFILSTSPS